MEPNGNSSVHVKINEESNRGNSNDFNQNSIDRVPEKTLTLFALRLAILEKAASGIGTLGFIWATVVLLGGFAITLGKIDFWFITVILLIEGARIFSRSHELELQHQATWSITDVPSFDSQTFVPSSNFQNPRTGELTNLAKDRKWATSEVPLLPYANWIFLSRNISKFLYWFQLLSASVCASLSIIRLVQQDFGESSKGETEKRNRNSALNIFYSLALAESLLFMLAKGYWEWKIRYCEMLERVNVACNLEIFDKDSIKRFFYDAFSKCINGSIFDGVKMDLVSFAAELLESDSDEEQLRGARILQKFSMEEHFSFYTTRKIGTLMPVIERLIGMLNWDKREEYEIRKAAAEIISKLAGKKQNSFRVIEIPGALESISSLLYCTTENQTNPKSTDELNDFSDLSYVGLKILKKLAHYHENCGKIGSTRGLLPRIIDFIYVEERKLCNYTPGSLSKVRRSLQLVKMLVSTTGNTGRNLRKMISENIFAISYVREILEHGQQHGELQKFSLEVLANLAFDEDGKERVGSTGKLLLILLSIFFGEKGDNNVVKSLAGEALAMLSLDSQRNCERILKLNVVERLIEKLKDTNLCKDSARILRNLCDGLNEPNSFHMMKGITTAMPTVLDIITRGEIQSQEAAIGLATQILRFMGSDESNIALKEFHNGVLAEKLIQILRDYPNPSIEVPRMRRFAIEMAIQMMKLKEKNIQFFKELGFKLILMKVLETTSRIECFSIISGSVGLNPHQVTIYSIVGLAFELLDKE